MFKHVNSILNLHFVNIVYKFNHIIVFLFTGQSFTFT